MRRRNFDKCENVEKLRDRFEKNPTQYIVFFYEEQHINRYDAKKLGSHLKESGYDAGNMNSFMSFSPFIAALSWQLSRFVSRNDLYSGRFRFIGMLLIGIANPVQD